MTVVIRQEAVRPSPCIAPRADDADMTNRRRELHEQLWLHRQIYHLRGRYDCEPAVSVAEAIALGERLMRRCRSQIVPAAFGSR